MMQNEEIENENEEKQIAKIEREKNQTRKKTWMKMGKENVRVPTMVKRNEWEEEEVKV